MYSRKYSDTFSFFIILAISLMIFLPGCDSTPTEVEKYDREPVLTAFLTNGEPIEEVFLERVAPLFAVYRFEDFAIIGAAIRIIDLDDRDTLNMMDDPVNPGRYIPNNGEGMIAQGHHKYRLEATTPDNEFLWAETSVPDVLANMRIYLKGLNIRWEVYPDMDSAHISDTTMVVHGDTLTMPVLTRNHPYMYWEWDILDDNDLGGFIGVIAAETERDSLIPLDPNWDPNDPDDVLDDEDRGHGGHITMRHDARVVSVLWVYFDYEGPNRIELRAVSQEYYDYSLSSFRVMQGMLDNPIHNIHGGIGIFGGTSKLSLMLYLKRVEI